MVKWTLALVVLGLLAAPAVLAADEPATATAQTCTSVKDRAPVGAADKFPASVGQVYCFSLVTNGKDKVVHVWYHGDKEVFKTDLPVNGPRWRTWSAKKVQPGAWKVEVKDAAGAVLATANFTVE